jgi:hypothetical protein
MPLWLSATLSAQTPIALQPFASEMRLHGVKTFKQLLRKESVRGYTLPRTL